MFESLACYGEVEGAKSSDSDGLSLAECFFDIFGQVHQYALHVALTHAFATGHALRQLFGSYSATWLQGTLHSVVQLLHSFLGAEEFLPY